jgi:nucleoside-diphosphate-sugar epimerase
MEKKTLVIGANSFLGSNLIRQLKAKTSVTGIYHTNKDKLVNDVYNVSIDQLDKLEKDFDEVYVVSAAIITGEHDKTTRLALYKTNVELVAQICSSFPYSKIIFCSSVSIYRNGNERITETSAAGGSNEYGISKYWGERIVQQSSKYAILRFPSLYGPGMQLNTIIPVYIQQALTTQNINIWGNGSRLQNYIYIDDAVNYLLHAAEYPQNSTFLACSPHSTSNKELAAVIAEITNCNINFTGEDNSPSFLYNNEFTEKLLNYSSKTSLKEGLKLTIKWIEKRF